MFVVGFICQDIVFMIRENGKVVLLRFLIQIRQHLRVDTFLEEQFTRLYVDDLATVI